MHRFFKDDDFQHAIEGVLGGAFHGAAEPGEVLATAGRIKDKDADAWVREWTATADAVSAAGEDALAAGHRVSARSAALRASQYYAAALFLIDHAAHPERRDAIWRLQAGCWERFVDLAEPAGERIAIPYEGTTLSGWFFRAPGAAPGEPRPLIVMNNGSDGATSSMWVHGGAAAAERGHHWMTFDGPGQQSAMVEKGIPFRPDWEAVLTPVVDAMASRSDVDAARMAVIGVSQAGYWVPRALAFEHRFAAAVVDPGVVDVSASWMAPLPDVMRKQLAEGKTGAFDREMRIVERLSADTKATLAFRGAPYGLVDPTPSALYETVLSYRLGDEVADITTPMLITDPEGEQFWPGQSQQLHDLLPGEREIARFTARDGADRHCEPLAPAQRAARIFDWLDARLA